MNLKEIFRYILSDYTRYYGNGGGEEYRLNHKSHFVGVK